MVVGTCSEFCNYGIVSSIASSPDPLPTFNVGYNGRDSQGRGRGGGQNASPFPLNETLHTQNF